VTNSETTPAEGWPKENSPAGRPRRAIEREYLVVLADAVPLDTWREICQAAVETAKAGDPKARDWLARYLIGSQPLNLVALVADERAACSTEEEVERERRSRFQTRLLSDACSLLDTS
jgi:hypothetical protein